MLIGRHNFFIFSKGIKKDGRLFKIDLIANQTIPKGFLEIIV